MEMQRSILSDQTASDDEDDTGCGRSYLCNFCKRGFCTAQALGGHMNIHRKDRTNSRKQTKLIRKGSPGSAFSHLSFFSHETLMMNYAMRPKRRPDELWLFGDERRNAKGGVKMKLMGEEEEAGGLDLELRLGLAPSI